MLMLAVTLAQVLDDLYRLVNTIAAAAVAGLVAWIGAKFAAKIDAERRARLQATVQEHARNAVALVHQRTVKDLKDPSTSGAFDAAAKTAALNEATLRVERVAKAELDALTTPETRAEVITQAIERAVVERHERESDAPPAAPSSPPRA